MHATTELAEADRLMTVCNSCRYCEGLCAVFPAMEMQRAFADADLRYLANLCHGCGACYYDCQFSPPHEFDVNVPKVLATVRAQSYQHYAWPRALAPAFARNGVAMAVAAAVGVAGFILAFAAANDPAVLFGRHAGPGAFYALMPHNAMALLFGAAFLYALAAFAMAGRTAWLEMGVTPRLRDVWQAAKDAATLRYLDGGGMGCMNADDRPVDSRRHSHHATAYGFALCFASTSVATLYHYLLGRDAPYPWWDLPVVLGTLGGLGLVVGTAGLFAAKLRRDAALRDDGAGAMGHAFIAMLFATGLSGLLLLFFRATGAMGPLLAIHLGIVFALFLTLPYGKFVHGLHRFAALVRYAQERRTLIDAG